MWSHLTYNEYPLSLTRLEIVDEFGVRKRRLRLGSWKRRTRMGRTPLIFGPLMGEVI